MSHWIGQVNYKSYKKNSSAANDDEQGNWGWVDQEPRILIQVCCFKHVSYRYYVLLPCWEDKSGSLRPLRVWSASWLWIYLRSFQSRARLPPVGEDEIALWCRFTATQRRFSKPAWGWCCSPEILKKKNKINGKGVQSWRPVLLNQKKSPNVLTLADYYSVKARFPPSNQRCEVSKMGRACPRWMRDPTVRLGPDLPLE